MLATAGDPEQLLTHDLVYAFQNVLEQPNMTGPQSGTTVPSSWTGLSSSSGSPADGCLLENLGGAEPWEWLRQNLGQDFHMEVSWVKV